MEPGHTSYRLRPMPPLAAGGMRDGADGSSRRPAFPPGKRLPAVYFRLCPCSGCNSTEILPLQKIGYHLFLRRFRAEKVEIRFGAPHLSSGGWPLPVTCGALPWIAAPFLRCIIPMGALGIAPHHSAGEKVALLKCPVVAKALWIQLMVIPLYDAYSA